MIEPEANAKIVIEAVLTKDGPAVQISLEGACSPSQLGATIAVCVANMLGMFRETCKVAGYDPTEFERVLFWDLFWKVDADLKQAEAMGKPPYEGLIQMIKEPENGEPEINR